MKKAKIDPALLVVAASCLLAANCSGESHFAPRSEPGIELLEKPEALLDPNFSPMAARLHGVALGDAKDEIACGLTKVNDAGWFQCGSDGQGRFRIRDERVVELSLRGKVLEGFAIRTLEDIERRFGPADEIEKKRALLIPYGTTFLYHRRGLRCSWLLTGDPGELLISITAPT